MALTNWKSNFLILKDLWKETSSSWFSGLSCQDGVLQHKMAATALNIGFLFQTGGRGCGGARYACALP